MKSNTYLAEFNTQFNKKINKNRGGLEISSNDVFREVVILYKQQKHQKFVTFESIGNPI